MKGLQVALLLCLAGWLTATEVRLIDHIAVEATSIRLGDIAIISGDGADRLRQLEVADLPSVGRTRSISAYRIKSLLHKQGWSDVDVKGLQSTVSVKTREVLPSEIRGIVTQWVQERTAEHQECKISFVDLPSSWEIPAGEDILVFVDSRTENPKGIVNLTLRAKAKDRVVATSRARVEVTLLQHAAVLVRPVRRGDKLGSEHVEIRQADVTKADGMEVTTPGDLIGMVAKRNLPVGRILSVNDFSRPNLIDRGSVNRIMVLNGEVSMGISGAEALQSGKKGDSILFKNPMNPKNPLRAEVVRPGLAIVRIR